MHNNNSLVSILTDTLPFEIPLIFSNRSLYYHLKQYEKEFLDINLQDCTTAE